MALKVEVAAATNELAIDDELTCKNNERHIDV